jgi:hypothetical protein
MHGRRRWSEQTESEWQDRVADAGEPLNSETVDVDAMLREAGEFAQMIAECTLGPIRELAAGLPRTIELEFTTWRRGRRGRRGWRCRY